METENERKERRSSERRMLDGTIKTTRKMATAESERGSNS